jgi:Mor family transcriptional regulator
LLVDKDAKLKARNKAIYEDRNDKGMSFRNLVEKYGISERSLRNAIASVTQSTVES